MLWHVRTILIARVCQSINLCQGSQKFRWIFTLFKLWKNWHTLSASWLRNFSFSFVWRHALADVFWSMSKSSSKKTAQRQKEPFRLWTPHKDTTNPKLPACHPWQLKNKKSKCGNRNTTGIAWQQLPTCAQWCYRTSCIFLYLWPPEIPASHFRGAITKSVRLSGGAMLACWMKAAKKSKLKIL